MSKIEVNEIDKTTGSTLTLGGSGTAVTLACGATQSGFGRTGTVDWQTTKKTADFTAANGEGYFVDSSSSAITVTLPSSPSARNIVSVSDYNGSAGTNSITIARNGSNINGDASNFRINKADVAITFVYVDATVGWTSVQTSNTADVSNPFIIATGGTVTECGNCRIHTFTAPGTFTVSSAACAAANNEVSYVVVAGGGGGGKFNTVGINGGSGGGGGGRGSFAGGSGNTPPVTPPQGQNGGVSATMPAPGGSGSNDRGGGGGGAGAVGGNAGGTPPSNSGNGGNGVTSCISGTPAAFAGGGGGGFDGGSGTTGTGGTGGGAAGATSDNTPGPGGTANTGGGGGGAGTASPLGNTDGCATAGGSGIVIIRYRYQ